MRGRPRRQGERSVTNPSILPKEDGGRVLCERSGQASA